MNTTIELIQGLSNKISEINLEIQKIERLKIAKNMKDQLLDQARDKLLYFRAQLSQHLVIGC